MPSTTFKKLGMLLALLGPASAYVWPNPKLDALESLIYDQTGFNIKAIANQVTPCSSFSFGDTVNRSNAADWIRTAYHDMATHNVEDGTGGLDGSIQFEMGRPENVGDGFFNTLRFLTLEINRYVTVADIVAIGAKLAIEQCSGPKVDLRGGRVDATVANAPGVPQPFETLDSHIASFARQGFNQTEMITLIACGHSFGGVQHSSFPDIVPEQPGVDDVQATFDSTPFNFDNNIALEYVHDTTMDPLVVGHNDTNNSDKRIFGSDGNATMNSFANSPELFKSTCATLFARMLETVPSGVELSEVIEPLPVKPQSMLLEFMGDGTLHLTGLVRFWNTSESATRKVTLRWADRTGAALPAYADVMGHTPDMVSGALYGGAIDVDATWYSVGPLSTNFTVIDASAGLSKVWFELDEAGDGASVVTEDQGGVGFVLQDTVMLAASSCRDGGVARVDIAVRADVNPSQIFLEHELIQGGIAAPNTATDEPTTIAVITYDAQPVNTTSGSGTGAYAIWRTEVSFSSLSPSLTTSDVNIVAEVGGARVETESFSVTGFAPCTA